MLFNSLQFALFFIVVTTLYFCLPHKYRWMLLLGASCLFYMAFIPAYIFILLAVILIDYFAGIKIEESTGSRKKMFLILSIASTCLVLFIFKYFNFFNINFAALADLFNLQYSSKMINIILPVGLSFHTFQSLAYVIEVYRGKFKAERHFGIYSLYVMFYPQLVAGPIERPQNLLPQFRQKHFFDYTRVIDGLKLMAWGLFKKVVVADRLATAVNQVFGNPTDYVGLSLIIASIFFTFQIYADFSGYSDIAIGAAKVMGFDLMENFRKPYFSKSISEFWSRWHISLMSWFRDYVYIPLGGNRVSKLRNYLNIMYVFVLSGFWHGANWTYVLWGIISGFFILIEKATKNKFEFFKDKIKSLKFNKIIDFTQVTRTMILVSFAFIFFRANSISNAWYIVTHLFWGIENIIHYEYIRQSVYSLGYSKIDLIPAIGALFFMIFVDYVERNGNSKYMFLGRSAWFRWSMYYLIILGILFLGVLENSAFIYFQF